MGETIEQSRRHFGVAEHARPFAEGEIGGHDDRCSLIEPADEMEEQLPAGLREGQVSEFIEDQEVEAAEDVRHAPLTIGTRLGIELVDEIDDVEEPSPRTTPDAGAGDADGEMGFARAGTADQNQVALMLQECPAGQVPYQGLVDRCVVEAELVDLLGQRQLGDGHLVFDRARLLLADLGMQEVADDLLRFVLALDGGGENLVIGSLHAVELELSHRVENLRSFHGRVS